jgi:hypothetical protein
LEARDYSAFDASEIAQMDHGPHDFAARYRRSGLTGAVRDSLLIKRLSLARLFTYMI